MAIKYGRKKQKNYNFLSAVVAAVLVCAVFLLMVNLFYRNAEEKAYEMLHLQTKQIKDDLTLQMLSDRENLITMANFASKMYSHGEGYDRIFESFKAIGLFSNVGILDRDNNFYSKEGGKFVNLTGKLSFDEESAKGMYISTRTPSFIYEGEEVIRSSVPIVIDGETVAVLYGIIRLDVINKKYSEMAKSLDAQLFVYDKEQGKFVVDTFNETPGELTEFKNRDYNDDCSYEQMVESDNGFASFKSIRTDEDLYVHYSTIEDFNWGIMLGRYESQVFSETRTMSQVLFLYFGMMLLVIAVYVILVIKKERNYSKVTRQASDVRKLLIEINRQKASIFEALKKIQQFSASRSAFYVDTDGDDYNYVQPTVHDNLVNGDERTYLVGELFRYAGDYHDINKQTLSYMRIVSDNRLLKTNAALFEFLKSHKIREISFTVITDENNHKSILGVINPRKSTVARVLLEDVSVCFSIAIYGKKHLKRTEVAATTDSLTGVLNRVSYKKDILEFDEKKPDDFSCVYIDVNELHLRNNRFGHAAGDEMLIFIANTLKETFYGHKVYRMGGDEFLVLAKETEQESIKKMVSVFVERLDPMGYTVAIGLSFRSRNTNCDEMVREAELRMYEAKAEYYQKKEVKSTSVSENKDFVESKTGIKEVDTMLSVLKEHYNGIYRVSLKDNYAYRILMPSYLGYKEYEDDFKGILKKYIDEMVHPDFHRAVSSFLNYDAIARQLSAGYVPKITYKRIDGESVILSVYNLSENPEEIDETLWVYSKD